MADKKDNKKEEKNRKKKDYRKLRWDNILSALAYIVIGMLLVLFPESIVKSICYAIAGVVIAVGVFKIITYLIKNKKDETTSEAGLIFGIIFLIFGIFFGVGYKMFAGIVPFCLGILLLVSGLSKLSAYMQIKKYAKEKDKVMFIISVANILLGLFMALSPWRAAKLAIRILGIFLVIAGVLDVYGTFHLYNKIKNALKEEKALEQDYKEVKK